MVNHLRCYFNFPVCCCNLFADRDVENKTFKIHINYTLLVKYVSQQIFSILFMQIKFKNPILKNNNNNNKIN